MKALSWILVLLAIVAGALFLLFSFPSEEPQTQPSILKEGAQPTVTTQAPDAMPVEAAQPVPVAEDRTRMEVPVPKEHAAKAPSGSTMLSGAVTDSAGRPLSGVNVSVFENEIPNFSMDGGEFVTVKNSQNAIASATTGSDGRFRIADLRLTKAPRDGGKVAVNLSFALPGFVIAGGLAPFSLVPGTPRETGPFVLYREAKISGRIEAAGARLESARVNAQMARKGEPEFFMNIEGGSVAADGSFEISRLTPGDWIVRGSAKGLLGASSEPVTLAEGESKTGVVLSLQEGLSIEGRITGPAGQPVEGAQILLTRTFKSLHEMEEQGGHIERGPGDKNLTDAQGAYRISGLHPGEYALRIKAKGFAETSRSNVQAGSRSVDFRLGERGSIAGFLQDSAGSAALANGKIRAQRVIEGAMIGIMNRDAGEAKSDEKGAFRLEGLEPGRYRLDIVREGFAPKSIEEVLVESARETALGSISLGHGGSLRISIVEGGEEKGIADASAKISPVKEQEMDAPGERRRMVMIGGPTRGKELWQARSDARGVVVFENLPAGRYLVEASHPEKAAAKEEVILAEGQEQRVTLRLSSGASLCGNTFTVDGLPYASASLRLVSEEGARQDTLSDAQGKYCFRHLGAGKYWIELREEASGADQFFESGEEGASPEGAELSLADGQEMQFDVHATPKGSLSGVVRQGETPAEGVRVTIGQGDMPMGGAFVFGPGRKLANSDNAGGYLLEKIKPGKYTVSASRPGAAIPVKASMEIRAGENHLDLQIPGGVIEGVVLDAASGKPVAGARVQAEEDEGGKQRRQMFAISISMGDDQGGSVVTSDGAGEPSKTDAEGKFRLRDMPAGKFRLRVKDVPGYADKEISGVELGKDERKQGVELKLERGGMVRGKLLDSAGNPVSFGFLFLEKKPASGPPKITGTGPDGSFRFDGVVAGDYKLRTGMQGEKGVEVEFAVKAGETVEKELRMAPK